MQEQELSCRSPGGQVGVKTQRGCGTGRCWRPGEGADVSGTGLEKRVDHIPSTGQLGQEKGLIHTCLHPLTLQRLAQPLHSCFPTENEEPKPTKMTYALLLLLGITRLPPVPFPLSKQLQRAQHMHQHRLLPARMPPAAAAAHGAKETRQEVTVLGGELTPQPQHDL